MATSRAAGPSTPFSDALDAWSDHVEGGVNYVAKATGFVHFTVGFDGGRGSRVVAPQHCIIAFPIRGQKSKHHSALFTLRVVREEDIPRDPNVQGPVANHLRYKPPVDRRAIPGADEYVEFELLSRAHEKPSQQPLRIAMGAARANDDSGHKEFVRIDLGQCITFIATDIIDDPITGQRLVQNRWWMCIETLRLLCTVNRIDCTALDKPGTPLEWVICLVDMRAPVNKKEQPQEPPEKNINELMEFIDGRDQRKAIAKENGHRISDAPQLRQPRGRKKKSSKDRLLNDGAASGNDLMQELNHRGGELEPFEHSDIHCATAELQSSDHVELLIDPDNHDCRPKHHGNLCAVDQDLLITGLSVTGHAKDPQDTDLMDELAKKYQRLQESSRQLEVDTKVATVRELLEVLDELERAGDALQEDSPASRTLSAISSKFETRLRGMGFERVETLGQPFDPQLHSMVTQGRASSEAPREPEVIVEELESGWILGNTVVRPALVSTQH